MGCCGDVDVAEQGQSDVGGVDRDGEGDHDVGHRAGDEGASDDRHRRVVQVGVRVGEFGPSAGQRADAAEGAHAAEAVQDDGSEIRGRHQPFPGALLGEPSGEAHVQRDEQARQQEHDGRRPLHRRGDGEDHGHRRTGRQALGKDLGVEVGDVVGQFHARLGRRRGIGLYAPPSGGQQPGHQVPADRGTDPSAARGLGPGRTPCGRRSEHSPGSEQQDIRLEPGRLCTVVQGAGGDPGQGRPLDDGEHRPQNLAHGGRPQPSASGQRGGGQPVACLFRRDHGPGPLSRRHRSADGR
jgi:hypothetical protein